MDRLLEPDGEEAHHLGSQAGADLVGGLDPHPREGFSSDPATQYLVVCGLGGVVRAPTILRDVQDQPSTRITNAINASGLLRRSSSQ